jgi:hypothetical protein
VHSFHYGGGEYTVFTVVEVNTLVTSGGGEYSGFTLVEVGTQSSL